MIKICVYTYDDSDMTVDDLKGYLHKTKRVLNKYPDSGVMSVIDTIDNILEQIQKLQDKGRGLRQVIKRVKFTEEDKQTIRRFIKQYDDDLSTQERKCLWYFLKMS